MKYGSLVAVKSLPAMQETWVRSLGWGRSPGDGNGNLILAWRIPWTEQPGGLQSIGSQRVTQLSDYPHILVERSVLEHTQIVE